MQYKNLENLSSGQFKRLTGVSRNTFSRMVLIVNQEKKVSKKYKGGRYPKLNTEDTILMMLEYLREYRTYFHIAQSYRISESAAFKNIRFAEDALIKSKEFALPGRKALTVLKPSNTILIDVTESPIERPKKKSASILFRQEEATHHQDSVSC